MMSPHVMPRPIVSQIANVNTKCECEREHEMRTLKTNARRPRANQTPRNVTTRHVRHILTHSDQTKPKNIPLTQRIC